METKKLFITLLLISLAFCFIDDKEENDKDSLEKFKSNSREKIITHSKLCSA